MKDKLIILLVSPYSAKTVGGIGTWSKIVLDYSKEVDDCDVRFLNTVQGLPKRWAMNYRLAHIVIGLLDSFLILFRLFWRMLFLRPTVVHYTSSAGSALKKDLIAVWIVKKLFRKKFVVHWHFGRIPTIFAEKGKEYHLFVKVCNNCDISIPIDERSFKVLKDENITSVYIPNPIPVALQNEAEILSVSDVSANRKKGEVLFVGHVLKGKGIVELIKACAECVDVKRLVVVGPFFDDSFKNDLLSIANKRENGNWLNLVGEKNREDVWNYYKTCSVFCLPSYSEGFPYVILEAMAFACPIVATKVGAIPEMLSEDCGELIEARQTEPIVESLNNVLGNKNMADKMGLRAHKRVLDNYTIEKIFHQYLEVWNDNK